ncbi:MAG: sigma-70 family RNA polymerase sigma factor [Solirubrobacteraceae bacterium]
MSRLQLGDLQALEALYDRHSAPAFALALRIVHDPATAADVTQEAFLGFWRNRQTYDRNRCESVRPWLLTIVRHRAIDGLRRERGRPFTASVATAERAPEAAHASTEAQVLALEDRRELQARLAQLPREQCEVLVLAYYGGYTQSEIARRLGAPLGTVKGRIRLGLERLRDLDLRTLTGD